VPVHAFVDEVKEPGYRLVAAMLSPDAPTPARKALGKLALPGQHRPLVSDVRRLWLELRQYRERTEMRGTRTTHRPEGYRVHFMALVLRA
jgi:hypothetical protein